MPNPITIIIVDDHEVVRNGIRSYLETVPEFQVVGEAASGEEAIALVTELIPDIVLMDLIMPGHGRRGDHPPHQARSARAPRWWY